MNSEKQKPQELELAPIEDKPIAESNILDGIDLDGVDVKSIIVPMTSHDNFIMKAMEKGDIETIERMVALKERFETGEAKKAFHEAMSKFQSIRPELKKTGKVNFKGKTGIITNYNFCPLPEIEKCIKQPLFECGLSYRYQNIFKDEREGLRCTVTHNLGHSEQTDLFAPVDDTGNKNALQQIASRNTYLQRYTLISALALASADQDDDGVNAGDMPYVMLIKHNTALRDNLEVVSGIKLALDEEDYYSCEEYICAMGYDILEALWVAPSKGGVFTTKEREILKSEKYEIVKKQFYAAKNVPE